MLQVTRIDHARRMITEPHQHPFGQLYLVMHGLLQIETAQGRWAMPCGRLGWLPAHCVHSALICRDTQAWSLYLSPALCVGLPQAPAVFTATPLVHAAVLRLAEYSADELGSDRTGHLLRVLFDELADSPLESLMLPMPVDPRLRRIADALLLKPDDRRQQQQWAAWSGLGVRTLSRRFLAETGMTYHQWRQQARLMASLARLREGNSVANCAAAVGYDNVSAYIEAFKRLFHQTPGTLFRTERR